MLHLSSREFRGTAFPLEALSRPIEIESDDTAARTEQTLRELRQQYSYLLHAIPGVLYRCCVEAPWKMLFVSKRVEELTGYRREEFEQGKPWAEIIHPDDLERVTTIVAEAASEGREFAATYRILHRSGEVKWVREQGQISSADGYPPFHIDGFIDDVTEQLLLQQSVREAEAEAKRRSETLAAVLESTSDCVYSLNREWRLTYLNGRAQAYFGSRGDLIGRSILEIFPDGRHSVFRDCFKRAMESGEGASGEGYLPSRGCWVEIRVAPAADGVTVFFRDITERKSLEKMEREAAVRWRATLDVIPQMVWSMAANGRRPDYYNERWYEFTGLPAGSLAGPEWLAVYHPDDQQSALSAWRRSRSSGEPYEAEYRVRHHSGEYRWVVSRARAERNKAGEIVRWYGTCTDVHEQHLHQQAVNESERRIQTILDSVPQIIWCADPRGKIDFLSNQWADTYGGSKHNVLGDAWLDTVHPDDRERAAQDWARSVASGDPYETEFRFLQPSGEYHWALVQALPERDGQGEITRWYGTCTDIHARVMAQELLDQSEKLNRGIVEASPDCMSVLDRDGSVLFVNKATMRAYGAEDACALIGKPWGRAFAGNAAAEAEKAILAAQQGKIGRLVLKGGPRLDQWFDVVVAPILDGDGTPINLIVISRDFTDQKEAEEKAQWAANHDSLTKLPNRFLLQKRLEEATVQAEAVGGSFALLLLDVDYLKRVNDGLGHDAGDALLCEFAGRLKRAVRADDMVARLGGDEFAIIISGVGDQAGIDKCADAIRRQLAEPFSYAGRMIDCQATIGASIFPEHGRCKVELMKNSDVALYAAKSGARGSLSVFHPSMREEIQKRNSMLAIAREALRNEWIEPYYQPKIDLRSGAVCGFEALLRWRHPSNGIQIPATISAAFEDSTLCVEISECMILKVIEDLKRWRREGVDFGHVAINASAAEFMRPDFVERLLARLRAAGLSTSDIQMEVTETVFLGRGAEYVERALRDLNAAGVKIALDDFGTGYASLSHLNRFPVDFLKIDRSFVQALGRDPGGAAIVEAVLGLGASLGIGIVAEGIEEIHQHDFLVGRGCQVAQGFLYSQAAPASEVPELIDLLGKSAPAIGRGTVRISGAARGTRAAACNRVDPCAASFLRSGRGIASA